MGTAPPSRHSRFGTTNSGSGTPPYRRFAAARASPVGGSAAVDGKGWPQLPIAGASAVGSGSGLPPRSQAKIGEAPVYTLEEVSQHCVMGDLWMAIGGDVYDITRFAKIHPGGIAPLKKFAGKDATKAFFSLHRAGTLGRYRHLRIGRLATAAPLPEQALLGAAVASRPFGQGMGPWHATAPRYNETSTNVHLRVTSNVIPRIALAEQGHTMSASTKLSPDDLSILALLFVAVVASWISFVVLRFCRGASSARKEKCSTWSSRAAIKTEQEPGYVSF
eukprot:gnl/TRDRNA2_/TRDRNA2_83412_c0_seq1.p1 gnl/TRDRNA2_/TRDRNA2_83412_c0~~gnl/TRDRNA2_/TRDRNA2_83412_c0_seq1.p1  ORF type:complete len:301 (+),score=28.99 gnl/TRDRNA2_/TRDRNA2_83412_c0_seq1:74-904(+)